MRHASLLYLCSAAALAAAAHGATITIDAERLNDAVGSAMPTSGLVVLTAGTSGSFTGPDPGNFATGSEIVLKKWDLTGGFGMSGILAATTGDLSFTGAWNQGDPLRLYWYPTLTLAGTAPGAGTPYGAYRDSTGLDGSAPWITPGAGDSITLKFFTTQASFLAAGGSNPASVGLAGFVVVPEPGTASLLVCGVVALRRRRGFA